MQHALSTAILASVLLAAPAAQAEPAAILLSPHGALIQGELTLTPQENGRILRLTLPPSADPKSLDLSVSGHDVAALSFVESPFSDSPATAALRSELNRVKHAILAETDALGDVRARQQYWRQPPIQMDSPSELTELDRLMQAQQASLRGAEAEATRRLEELEQQAALLTRRLEEAGGNAARMSEAVIELAAPASGQVTARYSYTLDDAGWRPLYRVEALPDAGEVHIALEAELWQRSGSDWTDAHLVLTTADPRQSMAPPMLNDWVIRPAPQAQPMPRSNEAMLKTMAMPMAADMEDAAVMVAGAAPVYADGATFESWDMGARTIAAGPSMRLPLNRTTVKAEFSYILRPSRSETAFLSARLNMPELRHLPAGEGLFLVDGVTVGRAPFSLANDNRRLYFGRDPQVSAVMRRNEQQSGKAGIIDRKQTYSWDWTITVFNKHDRAILARVEEPAPQSRDAQIVLNVKSSPEAAKDDHTLVWEQNVPARGSVEIRHAVNFTAPPDMNVREGR